MALEHVARAMCMPQSPDDGAIRDIQLDDGSVEHEDVVRHVGVPVGLGVVPGVDVGELEVVADGVILHQGLDTVQLPGGHVHRVADHLREVFGPSLPPGKIFW